MGMVDGAVALLSFPTRAIWTAVSVSYRSPIRVPERPLFKSHRRATRLEER
jgi:hypothetical protein